MPIALATLRGLHQLTIPATSATKGLPSSFLPSALHSLLFKKVDDIYADHRFIEYQPALYLSTNTSKNRKKRRDETRRPSALPAKRVSVLAGRKRSRKTAISLISRLFTNVDTLKSLHEMLVTGEHYNHIEYTNNDKITIPLKEPQKKGQIESVRKIDLNILVKTNTRSLNAVGEIHEIKLDSSVIVSTPMRIESQNNDFMSTSDLTTIAPAFNVDENKPLFSLSNSSMSFTKVAFPITNQILAAVDEHSHFQTRSCLLESNGRKLFEVDGTLMLINTILMQPTTTSPLIVSPSANGEVGLFFCRVEQTRNVARSPFLGNTLRTLQLCHCEIRNVSHCPSTSSPEGLLAGQTSSLIVGNSFEFNEDVLDGNVFVGLNEHFSFTSLNNTHFHTRRTGLSNTERQVITEANTTSNNLFSFTGDTFLGCFAEEGVHGGAISFSHSANLEIGVCSFQSCYVTGTMFGGAVYFLSLAPSGQTVSITDSRFFKCSTPSIGGGLCLYSDTLGASSASMTGCKFEENTAHYIDSCLVFKVKDMSLHNSLFRDGIVTEHEGFWKLYVCPGTFESTSCEVIGGTGATSGSFGFRNTKGPHSFKFWKISEIRGNAPAVFVFADRLEGESSLPVLTFEDCWFEAGGATTDEQDFRLSGPNTLSKSSFVRSYSTNKALSITRWNGSADVNENLLLRDVVVDVTNGVDEKFCWVPEFGKGCKTIENTLTRLNPLFEGRILLKNTLESGMVQVDQPNVAVGARKWEFVGDGKDKVSIVHSSASVLFTVTTGSLTLDALSLVLKLDSSLVEVSEGGSFELKDAIVEGASQPGIIFTKPFFVGRKGSLSFDSVRVSSFVFKNAAPIQITNAGTTLLTIQSSNFTSITRKEGSGVVVSTTLSTDSKVTIDNCRFSDCHSLDEDYTGHDITDTEVKTPIATYRGGVVRATGDDTKPGAVEITNSRFEENTIAGGSGGGVYVNAIGSLTLTSCHIEDIDAKGIGSKGAAVTIRNVSLSKVTGCDFVECRISKPQYGAYAGALALTNGQIFIEGCTFTKCWCAYIIGTVFLDEVVSGSSVSDCQFIACRNVVDGIFFIWSSAGLSVTNISLVDCGNSGQEWAPLQFGSKVPSHVTVKGLYVASSNLQLHDGTVVIDPAWFLGTSSLTFLNCQFLCNEPFITNETDFSAGFLTPQLRVAAEANLAATEDETMCGHPSRSCKTVSFALKLCPSVLSTSEFVLISIGEGVHVEDSLVIDGKKIKLTNSDTTKPAQLKSKDATGSLLSVEEDSVHIIEALFVVITSVDAEKATISSSGTLTLSAVTFVNPSSSSTISGHLVDFTGGSGTVTKCVFPSCSISLGTSMIRVQSDASVDLREQDLDLLSSELGTFLNIVGTSTIESCSFSNITSISSFLTGSGSLTIVDSTFFSVEENVLLSSPCHSVEFSVRDDQTLSIGAESKTVSFTSCSSRGEGGALHCSISGTITTGSFRTGEDISFTNCEAEDGNGDGLFILSSDLSAFLLPLTTSSALTSIKPAFVANTVFTDEDRDVLWGRETKDGGTEGSLLFYWHPHTTGPVHLLTGGEDHMLCGVTELPCSTLPQAISNMKTPSLEYEKPEVVIDSDYSLSSTLSSTVPKWILSGSTSNSLIIENGAQITIKNGVSSSLVLSSLSIVFGADSESRTTPILDVQSGTVEMKDCSVNSDEKSTASSLLVVGEGTLTLTSGSIKTPSASHPLVSITAGSFSMNTKEVSVGIQTTRFSPLISMSGGTSFISGPMSSLLSSHPALSLNGTGMLKLVSNNDFANGGVGSLVEMDGGRLEMDSSIFEKATLSSSLISGIGTVSIHNSLFTSLVDSTTSSSNSEPARALILFVGIDQKLELGAESKPVKFKLCSSGGDGGAVHCSISGTGMLSISHTTFDECSSQTIGGGLAIVCSGDVISSSLSINAKFTSCSSTTRSGNALHLTASSFESLIDSSRWRLNDNALTSPHNDDVMWGEDLAENSETKDRSITLLYYLFPYRHSEISTSVDGRDGEGCGTSAYPCSSFGKAHSHLVGDHTLSLEVIGKTRLHGTVSLSKQDLLIEPQSGVGVVEVISDGQISNNHPSTTSHKISITHISFDLSSATAQSIVSSNSGEIVFASSNITCTISLSSTLFSISGGSLKVTEFVLKTPSTSNGQLSSKIFSVSGGTIQLTTLNLTGLHFNSIPIELSSSTGSFFNVTDISTATARLLSASNSTLHLTQTDFSGQRPISPTNDEDMCGWSTGFVSLDNCTTTLTGSSFSHFENGAIAMKDGNMTIKTSSFDENSPHFPDFPSFHRNIACVGNGLIEIETLSGGDGSTDKLSSGWMKMEEDCSVLSGLVEPYEVFFIPSISKNVVSYEKKTKLFDVTIEGERLIPCGLSLEVFEVLKGTRKNSTKVDPLSSSPKNWTEKSFSVTLNESTLLNTLSAEPEWHARLLFGVDGVTTSFKVKESLAAIKKAHTSETMKWLLPVIIGVSALLLLILLILLLLWCRQRRKKNAQLASQAELNDLPEVMDEKMEIVDENTVGTTAFVFDKAAEAQSNSFLHFNNGQSCQMSEEISPDVGVVRGMMMDGQEQVVRINRRDTLFNRLHRPAPHHLNQKLNKKSVQAQIAAGLVQFDMFNLAAYISNFSPHSIIVQDNNEVLFNLSHDEKQGTTQNNGTTGNEAQRWQAPEQAPNEKGVDKTTNPSHGAVFSLGLVLWEIETELVPFRELDAANAQRALATGTGLDMNLVSDTELRVKIEQCLSLNPEERPTLTDLSSFLSSRSGELPKQPNGSDQKQNVQFASRI
ncbi:hypothetical protein BLNAU_13555 [Blattamonas nauphoetae]|uniref:Protein kinase domain-containing protein n=1 Tax=Blattamonas nauphoetae TaxID=2049346 RepID=A0ABQ9XGD6_9EUKA|nr:hypothetical protein BLNAU_13555 [Blattamonas nauphoetae]